MNEILLKIPYGSKKQKKNNKKRHYPPKWFLPMLELKRRFKLSENSKITKLGLFAKILTDTWEAEILAAERTKSTKQYLQQFMTIWQKLAAATTFLSVLTWKKMKKFSDKRMDALWLMKFWIRGFSKLKNKDLAVVCLLFESWRAFQKSSALSFFPPGVANPEK